MTHILETATSTDIVIFQNGMKDHQSGVPFDFQADPFWIAGWMAASDQIWSVTFPKATCLAPNAWVNPPNT